MWKGYFAQIYPQKLWASRQPAHMSLLCCGNAMKGLPRFYAWKNIL
jgi:hypothetical protein